MSTTNSTRVGHVNADTVTDTEALTLLDLNEYWCEQRQEPFTPFGQDTCDAIVAYLRFFDEAKVREAIDVGIRKHCQSMGFVIRVLKNWQERKAYAAQFSTIERAMYLREKARKGGQSTSEAKATAARENGKLGGRPRKVEPTPAPTVASASPHVLADEPDFDALYVAPVALRVDDEEEDLSCFDDEPVVVRARQPAKRFGYEDNKVWSYTCMKCGETHVTVSQIESETQPCKKRAA